MTIRETAIAKIQHLPESLVKEIIDFIDFIAHKHQIQDPKAPPEKGYSGAWDQWFETADKLQIAPGTSTSEYQQQLLNKYRQQGLNL